MAVGSGLRVLRARVSGCAVRNRAYRWRILRALRARVPGARLETATTGGVSGLRALRARVLHGSHGI